MDVDLFFESFLSQISMYTVQHKVGHIYICYLCICVPIYVHTYIRYILFYVCFVHMCTHVYRVIHVGIRGQFV